MADEDIRISASLDVGPLQEGIKAAEAQIRELAEQVLNVNSEIAGGSAAVETSLSGIGAGAEAALETIIPSFAGLEQAISSIAAKNQQAGQTFAEYASSIAGTAVPALNELKAAQSDYASTSKVVQEAQLQFNAATENAQIALNLLKEAEAGATTNAKELVTAQKLVEETGIEAAVASQKYGTALAEQLQAQERLIASTQNAINVTRQFMAVQDEALAQATALQKGSATPAAAPTTTGAAAETAEIQQEGVVSQETQEAINNLTIAKERLAQASLEVNTALASNDAGAALAALQEQAEAENQVSAAEETLGARTTSLNTNLAEQRAILAESNVSWFDANNAYREIATSQTDLTAINQALNTATVQTTTSTTAATAATTAQATANTTVATSTTAATVATQNQANANTQLSGVTAVVNNLLQARGQLTQNVANALQALSTTTAQAGNTSQSLNQALATVNATLAKYNLGLQQTANGLQLVTVQQQRFNQEVDRGTGLAAYGTGRILAYEAGLGRLGFVFGSLARASSALAPIFAAVFIPTLVVAFADALQGMVEKFTKAQEEISKLITSFDDLAAEQIKEANATEIQNLRLEDQIAKFEGRPSSNKIKIAAIEAQQAVDALNKRLEDTVTKIQDLLDKADVSIFKSIYTGLASTSIFAGLGDQYAPLKDKLTDFRLALSELTEARQKAVLAGKSLDEQANDADIKSAQDTVEKKRTLLDKEVENLKKSISDQEKALATQQTTRGVRDVFGQQVVPPQQIPGESPEEIARALVGEKVAYQEVTNALQALDIQQKNVTASLPLRNKAAIDDVAAEVAARTKTTETGRIKDEEEIQKELAATIRDGAERQYRETEASAKRQVLVDIDKGISREQAEITANTTIIAARQALNQSLLTANQVEYDARIKAAKDIAALLSVEGKIETGVQRQRDLDAVNTQIKVLTSEAERKRLDIISASGIAILTEEDNINKQRLAEEQKASDDVAEVFRRSTKQIEQDSKDAASIELGFLKTTYDEELRTITASERVHLLTVNQAKDARVASLEEEKREVSSIIDQEIAKYLEQQAAIQQAIQATPQRDTSAIKSLNASYDSLTTAIRNAERQQEELNQQISRAETKAQVEAWQQNEKAVSDFITGSTQAFEQFTAGVIGTGHTLGQELYRVFLRIENDFIGMLVRMLEQTRLFTSISAALSDVLDKIFARRSITQGVPIQPPGVPQATTGTIASTIGTVPVPPVPTPTSISGPATFPVTPPTGLPVGPEIAALNLNTTALQGLTAAINTFHLGPTLPTTTSTTAIPTSATTQATTAATQNLNTQLSTATTNINRLGAATQVTATAQQVQSSAVSTSTTTQVVHTGTVAAATPTQLAHTGTVATATPTQIINTGAVAVGTKTEAVHAKAVAEDTVATQQHTTAQSGGGGGGLPGIPGGGGSGGGSGDLGLRSLFNSLVAGFKNLFTQLGSLFSQLASAITELVSVIVQAIIKLATLFFFAEGGLVQGAGTGTSDSITARVSHGEYIVNAESVGKPGVLPLLQSINSGSFDVQKFSRTSAVQLVPIYLSEASQVQSSSILKDSVLKDSITSSSSYLNNLSEIGTYKDTSQVSKASKDTSQVLKASFDEVSRTNSVQLIPVFSPESIKQNTANTSSYLSTSLSTLKQSVASSYLSEASKVQSSSILKDSVISSYLSTSLSALKHGIASSSAYLSASLSAVKQSIANSYLASSLSRIGIDTSKDSSSTVSLEGSSLSKIDTYKDSISRASYVNDSLEEGINRELGGGSYLDSSTSHMMGRALGANFSNVRIHTDRKADEYSRALNAYAFTVGKDIFFRTGTYDPKSAFGQTLIAHELVHTIQHGSSPKTAMAVSHPRDSSEIEAYSISEKVTAGGPAAFESKYGKFASTSKETNYGSQVYHSLLNPGFYLTNSSLDSSKIDEVSTAAFSHGMTVLPTITAEKGAVLSRDSFVHAHAKEMILPAVLASGIEQMIASYPMLSKASNLSTLSNMAAISSINSSSLTSSNINTSHLIAPAVGGTEVTVNMGNVNAVDGEGLASVLNKGKYDIARIVSKQITSGHIDPRKMF